LSRYAFADPMTRKSQEESLRAFEVIAVKVMELSFTIGTVDSDMESAFRGREFKQFTSMNHITMHFIPVADQHGTAFVERFNRTLRILLEKLKLSQGSNEWAKFLPKLMENYNNRVHRTLGMSPKAALAKGELTKGGSTYIRKRFLVAEGQPLNVQQLQIGDKVRVMLRKNALLDKGSAPRFSVSRPTIESVIPGGLFTVSGRVEPYRVNELLKAGNEDSKQVQREERVVEQVAARRERRIDRRIAKEHIERFVEPAVPSKRKRPEINYYEGDDAPAPVVALPAQPKPRPVTQLKPVDNSFWYSFPSAKDYSEDEPLINRIAKPIAKPIVKPQVKPAQVKPRREEINLIDDEEDKPIKRAVNRLPGKPPLFHLSPHYDKNFEL